ASYALIEDVGPEAMLEWMSPADIVFPNRDEGRVLAGTADPEQILERLSRRFPLVVLKLDKDGARARAGGETCCVPSERLQVVDTTGAGDAFDAGFLAAYLKGWSLPKAVAAGVKASARVIQRLGST
ncbi:MAG: ribokinase, partial [Bacillota bacterium]